LFQFHQIIEGRTTMKRTLLVAGVLIAACSLTLGQKTISTTDRSRDEDALKQLVQELTEAVAHGDTDKLNQLQTDEFKGQGEGLSLSKRVLHDALRSGDAKVSSWTVDNLHVTVRGNSATVTGGCKLTGATYRGRDYSGGYHWTGRFVKQKDGSWRAVSLAVSKG
jgi:ketosteroid isomerase-like protein